MMYVNEEIDKYYNFFSNLRFLSLRLSPRPKSDILISVQEELLQRACHRTTEILHLAILFMFILSLFKYSLSMFGTK